MNADTVFETVQALLAKAQGTTFKAEAEAFTAKAHQLMLEYAIDEAQLRAAGKAVDEKPILVHWSYGGGVKSNQVAARRLASVVARANRCRCVFLTDEGTADIVGFKSDIEFVRMLYASLWVQAHCEAIIEVPDRRKVAVLASFFDGFADEVKERLEKQESEAEKASVGNSLALRDISQQVNETLREFYPRTSALRRVGRDYTGYNSGRAAGARADISGGRNQIR